MFSARRSSYVFKDYSYALTISDSEGFLACLASNCVPAGGTARQKTREGYSQDSYRQQFVLDMLIPVWDSCRNESPVW